MRTTHAVLLLLVACAVVLADKPTGDRGFPGHSGDRGHGHRPGGGKDSKEKTAPEAATGAKEKPAPAAAADVKAKNPLEAATAAIPNPTAALPKLPVQKRAAGAADLKAKAPAEAEIEGAASVKAPRAAAGMNMNAGELGSAGANVRGKRAWGIPDIPSIPKYPGQQKRAAQADLKAKVPAEEEIEAAPAKVPRAAAGMNMNAGELGSAGANVRGKRAAAGMNMNTPLGGANANLRGKRDNFGVKIKG